VVAIAVLGAAVGLAQEPPPPVTFVAVERVDVVNVEVVVTDRDGRLVPDLPREAFTVLEDGAPVEITNFAVLSGPALPERPAPGGVTGTPADGASGLRSPAASMPARGRLLVVWLDNLNLHAATSGELLRELEAWLAIRLAAGDRAMVASSDRRLAVHTPFTGDMAAVRAGLTAARAGIAGASAIALGRSEILGRMDNPLLKGLGEEATAVLHAIDAHAELVYVENLRMLERLRRFASALAGVAGHKAILLVSEGSPERPAEALYGAWHSRFGGRLGRDRAPQLQTASRSLAHAFRAVAADASAADVTLYPLLAGGSDVDAGVSAALRGIASDGTRYWDASTSSLDLLNRSQPLFYLAAATGGRAVLNVNAGTLAAAAQDLEAHYSLAYAAPHPGDGKTHGIEVRLSRPDLTVRHRTFYRSKPVTEHAVDLATATLLVASGENPLDVALDLRDRARPHGKALELEVMVTVPVSRVTLLPAQGGREGRLRVVFAIREADGAIADVQEVAVPVRIREADLAKAGARRIGTPARLLIRPGPQRLAVVVLDEVSEETARLVADLDVLRDGGVAIASSGR